jgi:hypothetical protein
VATPEVIYGITADKNQDLWLASDTGVFRVIKDTHEVVSYGVSDGMRVYECSGGGHPGIAGSPSGAIWFATLKGAALLLPNVPFNRIPPAVVVESVTVDNRTLDSESAITVGPGVSRLSFDYAALSFTAPQKVRYRYRLANFDKNWIDAGALRTAFYTNLSPGHYKFEVTARNGDGVWNQQSTVLGLELKPHFYQTSWFAGLVAAWLALTAFSVYRWRLSRVRAQVESRFRAVLEERNRIAREIHDTLAQGFAGVSVQLEIVSARRASIWTKPECWCEAACRRHGDLSGSYGRSLPRLRIWPPD